MANRYVSFVDDAHYEGCVRRVCERYAELEQDDERGLLLGSVVDPFKMVFDMRNRGLSLKSWEAIDATRIRDKAVNNAIGEFHQGLLGGVEGWVILPEGHKFGVDLARRDNTVFVELKNKYNTLSGSKVGSLYESLRSILDEHRDATCYWASILAANGTSGEEVWKYRNNTNPGIKKVWGRRVYGLVTGSDSALDEAWHALPRAMADIMGGGDNEARAAEIGAWFEYAFVRSGDANDALPLESFAE